MKLEVLVIPVSDADRAKDFYQRLGWRLDADVAGRRLPPDPVHAAGLGLLGPVRREPHAGRARFRPGLAAGRAPTSRPPATTWPAAASRSARCSTAPPGPRAGSATATGVFERVAGPAPDHGSYGSFASFSDPDGNGWILQEVTDPPARPGRRRRDRRSRPPPTSPAPCAAPRRPTASTRSARAPPTRTGPTGTPRTWSRSRPGRSCRHERARPARTGAGRPDRRRDRRQRGHRAGDGPARPGRGRRRHPHRPQSATG